MFRREVYLILVQLSSLYQGLEETLLCFIIFFLIDLLLIFNSFSVFNKYYCVCIPYIFIFLNACLFLGYLVNKLD